MLEHFKDSFHWTLALARFGSGKFEEAQIELGLITGPRSNYSEYLALLATTQIILMDDQSAKSLLFRALNQSDTKKPAYRKYVSLYCLYYISVIDGDEAGKVKYLEEALRVSAPSIIRNWLPLS